MRSALVSVLAVMIDLLSAGAAGAQDGPAGRTGASTQCEAAIAVAEQAEALPPGLLDAIGRVESGRFDPTRFATRPWPWTINADGIGRMFATKDAAINAVRGLQAQGVRSIDVGCLQVNLMQHPKAFATLDEAFDPAANVAYAARFLRELFAESLDWTQAAAAYHSRTPDLGMAYLQQVLAAWGTDAILVSSQSQPERMVRLLPAAPIPALRAFAPPPLPGGAMTEPPSQADDVARLLAQTPDCAAASPPATTSWGLSAHAPSCGRSPFATTSLLRRILAVR
jgi:hypothetical protein